MSAGWPVQRLGSVATVSAGNSAPQDKSLFARGTHTFIRTSDVGQIRVGEIRDSADKLNDLGVRGMRKFREGVTLVPKSGASTFNNHRVITAVEATVSSHLAVVDAHHGVLDDRYVFYFLQTVRAQDLIGDQSYPSLNLTHLESVEIPVPPLAEQQRIVAKLDEVMALGDRLQDRATLERVRSEELRQRLTVELMESSGPLVSLGGLCEVLDSKRQPITKKDRVPGPIPYYGATGVVDYVQDFLFDEDLVLLGEDGAKWGPGDRSAFAISGRTWVNNHAHVLRPDRKIVRDQWLIEYLNAADLEEYVTGLTVPKLNQAQMRSIPVPVPTLAVQDQVLARLNSVFELSVRLCEISAARKAKAEELRQSVLAAAFRGDL